MEPTGDFGLVQDLINDLVFDRWDPSKAYELRAILADLELSPELTGLEHPTPLIMERVHRLSRIRKGADKLPGDAAEIYDLLVRDYYRLLSMVIRCYRGMVTDHSRARAAGRPDLRG